MSTIFLEESEAVAAAAACTLEEDRTYVSLLSLSPVETELL